MELLTEQLRKRLPALYSTENESDPLVVAKFFTPDAQASWFAVEFDGEDMFFGWCDLCLNGAELGYFTLSALRAIRGHLGLPVERDLHFVPVPLSVVMAESG